MYRHGLFGTRREEKLFGTVAAFVANGARLIVRGLDKTVTGEEWSWLEVFPRPRPPTSRQQRNKELGFKLRMFAKGLGGG